jgi:hypothetical protein
MGYGYQLHQPLVITYNYVLCRSAVYIYGILDQSAFLYYTYGEYGFAKKCRRKYFDVNFNGEGVPSI